MPAYPIVEALEAVRREADRGRGCEVKVAAVKEVKEGILEDLCPHFEVGEVGIVALLKPIRVSKGICDKFGQLMREPTDRPPITALAMLPMPD